MFRRTWTLLAVVMMGCASESPNGDELLIDTPPAPRVDAPPPKPVVPPTEPIRMQPRDLVLGQSVKGTPITMQMFGTGPTTVFIMGGIHGDETTTVDLTTNLIELLKRHPEHLAGKRVAILRVANPDGYAARKRVNARNIDVNRNFPASNYKGTKRYGMTSASEPETQAIIAALEQTRPALIISIHSITKGRECNNYDGPGERIAQVMSGYNKYPVAASIGYPTPGSMGTYAGIDRKIPMITLELPRTASGEESWNLNRDALLAAIREAK